MIQIKLLLSRAYMHTIWNFMRCQYIFGRITLPVFQWNNGLFYLITHAVPNVELRIGFKLWSFQTKVFKIILM